MKPIIGFFALHYDPPIGGAERSMHSYFKELTNDYDIHVFCFLDKNGKKFFSTHTKYLDEVSVTTSSFDIERTVDEFIRQYSPKFIGTMLLGSDLVVDVCVKSNVPVVYFVHGLFEDCCKHYLLPSCEESDLSSCNFNINCPNGYQYSKNLKKYQDCLKVFCNSEYTENIFKRFYPDFFDKIEILYPNFDIDLFPFYENNDRDRSRVLAVNSSPLKGRNIIGYLAKENPNLNFIYVDCKDSDIEFLSQFSNIKIMGSLNREEMSALYKKVGAVVCPTMMSETFGGVTCESVLTGTPIISMNKGNLPNLINHGENGYLINSIDVKEWSYYLNKALDMNIGRNKSDEIRKKLDLNINVNKLKNIFGLNQNKEECIDLNEYGISRERRREIIMKLFGEKNG